MAIIPVLALIGGIALLVVEAFFIIQLTEAAINFLGDGQDNIFHTDNLLAWIVVFTLMCVAVWLIRGVTKRVNVLVALGLGALFNLGFAKEERSSVNGAALAIILIWAAWAIICFSITGFFLNYFSAHPELNDWLAEGGTLASVLIYFGVLGLVFPSLKKS